MSKFFVLEGNEGVGKGEQMRRLAGNLFSYDKSVEVLLTREPWRSVEIRKRLVEEKDPYSNAELMTKLYLEDRKNHLNIALFQA
jgi:thymidylate kinase